MYFVPLTQLQSVELLVHCLKAAGGEADCSMCPVCNVCMKQCLTLSDAISSMLSSGTLPQLNDSEDGEIESEEIVLSPEDGKPKSPAGGSSGRSGLRLVK